MSWSWPNYIPSHPVCSNCQDVKWRLGSYERDILLEECLTSCLAAGCSPSPNFTFMRQGGPVDCRPALPCFVYNFYETFTCNCDCCPTPGGPIV